MAIKMRLAAGDTVVVLAGKDKGKRGKVKFVRTAGRMVEVEGVNVVKRHAKPTQKNSKGGIIDKELPLQPLLLSDAYIHNNYKSYEDRSGYIPLKRKLKRGQKIRVKAGLLEGAVGTIAEDFEEDMRRGMVAASLDFMGARRVELPREDFEPIYTEFLRTTKSGVNPGGA